MIHDESKKCRTNILSISEWRLSSNPECGTSHYNLAVGLLGQKKYDEAERELLEAVDCSPSLAEAYVQLGGICLQRGDLEGCLAYNQRAIHSRAGFAEGHANIGFVYMQKGDDRCGDSGASKGHHIQLPVFAGLCHAGKCLPDEGLAGGKY